MLQTRTGTDVRADGPGSMISASMTVMRKSGDHKVIELRGTVTFLGSHKEVQVRLKHHTVAPAHCAVINTGTRLLLRDLASRSGTRLNDAPVQIAELRDGDTIRIGGWRFRIKLIRRSATSSCGGSSIAAVQLPPPPAISLESVQTHERWEDLPEVVVIGRRDTCDVCLDGTAVSRSHAMLCLLDSRLAVFDLKSANGLKVNGQKASMRYVTPGDVITIGGHDLRVSDVRLGHDRSGRRPGDSDKPNRIFDGSASERIKLLDPGGGGSAAGFMDVARISPELLGAGGLRVVPDRRDRLGARFEMQASELAERKAKLDTRERELADREATLAAREATLDARSAELDARERLLSERADKVEAYCHAADTRDAWFKARAAELDEREHRLEQAAQELDRRRESTGEGTAACLDGAAPAPSVADLCDVERRLAARQAVLDELAKSLDMRAMELDAVEREVKARQPVLAELAKSLEKRATELDARQAKANKTMDEIDAWRKTLAGRAAELDERDRAIRKQEELLKQMADPMAVSDERSYEVLRLLDPVLGDSVRVLRRLGIEGSFDELVERARCELSTRRRERRSRGKWSLFG